jgi:hypothetical protein
MGNFRHAAMSSHLPGWPIRFSFDPVHVFMNSLYAQVRYNLGAMVVSPAALTIPNVVIYFDAAAFGAARLTPA